MKYVWIYMPDTEEQEISIIDNPVDLFHNPAFDLNRDKIYQLGSEVKLKVMIEPVSKTRTKIIPTNIPVLRDASGHEIEELGRQ
jgi:fructose 1,6-bisphosphatase